MTRYVSGPHFIYKRDDLAIGEPTPWHKHNFPHNTVVANGVAQVEIGIDPVRLDERGVPIAFEHIETREVSSADAEFWMLAPSGVWHRITKLVVGTNVGCFFSHFDPETGKPLDRFDYRMGAYG